MKKAIILDAGEGKRLRPLTANMPKCLIKIGNKTILEHQLSSLVNCGIRELVIVVGYHFNMILDRLQRSPFDLEIKYVRNPIYHRTNTVYSLWLVRNEMDTDFLYLNGDVLFHEDVLRRLIDAKHDACFAIDTKRKVGQEEVKVRIVERTIKEIGKEIDPAMVNGEFVGVAKFSRKINSMFRRRLDEVIKEGKLNAFFEIAVQRILNECNVYAVDVSDLPCIEIDTYNDLEEARNIFLKIRGELK